MLPTRQHIPIIESLRGWAAAAICFYHFVWGTVDYIDAAWVRNLTYWGQYAVTLFFVLSGVVLPLALLRHGYTWRYFGRFLWRRCWRLEPPYFLSIVITLGYLGVQAWRHQQALDVSLGNVLWHIGYLVPLIEGERWLNPVYWSLAVEFQYYSVLAIIFPFWVNRKAAWRYASYILLFGLSLVSDQKDLIFRWLPLFVMSGGYALYSQHKIKGLEFFLLLFSGALILLWQLHWVHTLVVLGSLVLLHFFPLYNPNWSAWLGRCSYSLYLLHWPIGQALVNVLSHYYRLPFQKVLVLLLGYGSSVFAAAILYYWVERTSQRKAASISYGKRDD